MKKLAALVALLLAASSPLLAETLTWAAPLYFVKAGELCGGEINPDRTIPTAWTRNMYLEVRPFGGTDWLVATTFPAGSWVPGQTMTWVSPEAFDPGAWEFRVNAEVYEAEGGSPTSTLRAPCPSDILLVVVRDTCPVEKRPAPTLLP